jgi:hypothetical protein
MPHGFPGRTVALQRGAAMAQESDPPAGTTICGKWGHKTHHLLGQA